MEHSQAIAWAAGLFEGEGSICFYKLPRRKDSYKVSCSMSMTDQDVMERFASIVKVGRVKGPYKGTNKDKFIWEVQNYRECLYICELFRPYLLERRAQKADQLIELARQRLGMENSWKTLKKSSGESTTISETKVATPQESPNTSLKGFWKIITDWPAIEKAW